MSKNLETPVAEYIERRQDGDRISPEEYVEGHPHRGKERLSALRGFRRAEAVLQRGESMLREEIAGYRALGIIERGGDRSCSRRLGCTDAQVRTHSEV